MKTLILAAILFTSSLAQATEWEQQVLKTDAKAARCLEQTAAEQEARDRIKGDAGNLCREKGYGWHLEAVKNDGTLACSPCADGKARCQATNVELLCRRLKPGSTGMGMIPFLGGKD